LGADRGLPMSLEAMVVRLDRRNRWLTWFCGLLFTAWLLTISSMGYQAQAAAPQLPKGAVSPGTSDYLRVRGIVVVDEKGTERVWIGAPVPDPLIMGKRHPRGGKASGIVLLDEEGNERSGYVTMEGYPNVMFTLDGMDQQHVLFLTEPQGAPSLSMWNGDSRLQLGVSETAPWLKVFKNEKLIWNQDWTGKPSAIASTGGSQK
jgi:hypothetical protein